MNSDSEKKDKNFEDKNEELIIKDDQVEKKNKQFNC
mgnify:CR=1 FL=1